MGVLKGELSETIIRTDQKFYIKNCVEIILENLGASTVLFGKYPLGAGKREVYKSSTIVLDNEKELDIKFSSDNPVDNNLYVRTTIAVEVCTCLNAAK